MIKLNRPYTHVERAVSKTGTLQMEVASFRVEKNEVIFRVEDFLIDSNEAKQRIDSRDKSISITKYNELDAYLTANHDFSGLSKFDVEWEKTRLGLLIFVKSDFIDVEQTRLVYDTIPNEWIHS